MHWTESWLLPLWYIMRSAFFTMTNVQRYTATEPNNIYMLLSLIKKLSLLSMFCFALEVARMYATGKVHYIFLLWNLFLAWIPLIVAIAASRDMSKIKFGCYFVVWLLFFPNAPYIITDLIHLKPRSEIPLWFDSILLYSFAFTGLVIGILSAVIIYKRLTEITSPGFSKGILFFSMLLSGYGIYIGRFLRWNSWSILTDPLQLYNDTITRILHPTDYPGTYGVTLMVGTLLCLVFSVFESILRTHLNTTTISYTKKMLP